MKDGVARLEGFAGIDEGVDRVDLNVDQLERILGHVAVGRNDDRKRLAHVAHHVPRQRLLEERHQLGLGHDGGRDAVHLAEVGRGVDGRDAWQRARPGSIDPQDPAVRDRTAQDRSLEHSRLLEVADEATLPPQQAKVFLAPDRAAYVIRHGSASRTSAAPA